MIGEVAELAVHEAARALGGGAVVVVVAVVQVHGCHAHAAYSRASTSPWRFERKRAAVLRAPAKHDQPVDAPSESRPQMRALQQRVMQGVRLVRPLPAPPGAGAPAHAAAASAVGAVTPLQNRALKQLLVLGLQALRRSLALRVGNARQHSNAERVNGVPVGVEKGSTLVEVVVCLLSIVHVARELIQRSRRQEELLTRALGVVVDAAWLHARDARPTPCRWADRGGEQLDEVVRTESAPSRQRPTQLPAAALREHVAPPLCCAYMSAAYSNACSALAVNAPTVPTLFPSSTLCSDST